MSEKLSALYLAIQAIPKGRVSTYGNIAKLAGQPNGARWVGQMLSRLPSDSSLPWHRVINSQGKISLPGERGSVQRQRLIEEGVLVNDFKVSLSKFGWQRPE